MGGGEGASVDSGRGGVCSSLLGGCDEAIIRSAGENWGSGGEGETVHSVSACSAVFNSFRNTTSTITGDNGCLCLSGSAILGVDVIACWFLLMKELSLNNLKVFAQNVSYSDIMNYNKSSEQAKKLITS